MAAFAQSYAVLCFIVRWQSYSMRTVLPTLTHHVLFSHLLIIMLVSSRFLLLGHGTLLFRGRPFATAILEVCICLSVHVFAVSSAALDELFIVNMSNFSSFLLVMLISHSI